MLIKYSGGRSHYEVSYNRKPYYFTPENNRTIEITEPKVINYIFSLPNRAEFEVIEKPIIAEEPKTIPLEDKKERIEIKKKKKSKKRG